MQLMAGPQCSLLELFLLNIEISNLFLIIGDCDIANYVEENAS